MLTFLFHSVHPNVGITVKAMSIMEHFLHDIFELLYKEAGPLCKFNQNGTVHLLLHLHVGKFGGEGEGKGAAKVEGKLKARSKRGRRRRRHEEKRRR